MKIKYHFKNYFIILLFALKVNFIVCMSENETKQEDTNFQAGNNEFLDENRTNIIAGLIWYGPLNQKLIPADTRISQVALDNTINKINNVFKLIKSAINNDLVGIKQALESEADINATFECISKHTALHYAAILGKDSAIKFLLNQPGINVNALDDEGKTPLDAAIGAPQHVLMDIRHQDLANIGTQSPTLSTIKLLLQGGADLDKQTDSGFTSQELAYLCIKIHLDKAESAILNKNAQDATYHTNQAKRYVEISKFFEVFHELKINLFEAVNKSNLAILKILAKHITFYIKDENGNTPLHLAIKNQKIKIIELVLNVAPELIFWENNLGDTPIKIASNKPTALKYLITTFYNPILNNNN